MSDLRKKAMTRLVLCAVALVASIIFSVLLLTGNLDGQTGSGDATSVAGDTTSAAAGVDDPTADSFPAEATGDTAAPPAEEQPAAEPEPTPEPTPVPTFDGLSVQPAVIYNEGEQPSYTVTPDNNLNMRAGPGTDYDKVSKVPASTVVTALGANEDGSWVVVNYDGKYGWLKAEFLS